MNSRVVPASVRYAMIYGLRGGLVWGILMQLFYRFLFERILTQPDGLDRLSAPLLALSPLALALLGLLIVFLTFNRKAPISSHSQQIMIGGAIGLVFGLSVHAMASGAVGGLIASRSAFTLLSRTIDATRDQYQFQYLVFESIQRTMLEGFGINILAVFVLAVVGALFGRFMLPILRPDQRQETTPPVRNVFWSLGVIFLSLIFDAILIINIVVYSLLETSLYKPGSPLGAMPIITPMVVMVVTTWLIKTLMQVGGLVWLGLTAPEDIHRSGLWLAQFLYGVVIGIGQIFFWLAINPTYATKPPGVIMLAISVALVLVFIPLAQIRLREARQVNNETRVKLSFWETVRAVSSVMILGWLFTDLLAFRVGYNLSEITPALIIATNATTPIHPVITDILANVLHWGSIYSLIGLVIMTLVGSIIVIPFVAVITWTEKRTAN